jgi:biopolymer transport protein ExbB
MTQLPFANIIVDTFLHGGIIMWPLLVLSFSALAVIAERLFWWIAARRKLDPANLDRAYRALAQGERDQALEVAAKSSDPRLKVIAYGLEHPEAGLEVAMQVRQSDELKHARRFLSVMDTVITLAPLLGLLGTVTGIMQSFKFVGGDQELAAAKVSGGIGEALIATACGLGIAIITLLPFNLIGSYVEELREELDNVIKNVHLLLEKAKPANRERSFESVGASE